MTRSLHSLDIVLTQYLLSICSVFTQYLLSLDSVLTRPWLGLDSALTRPWLSLDSALTRPWLGLDSALTRSRLSLDSISNHFQFVYFQEWQHAWTVFWHHETGPNVIKLFFFLSMILRTNKLNCLPLMNLVFNFDILGLSQVRPLEWSNLFVNIRRGRKGLLVINTLAYLSIA